MTTLQTSQAALTAIDGPIASIAVRLAADVTAMALLVFGMYYRRYKDKELTTAAALFNLFIFAVLTVLSSVNFGVAAGFGLFAILALFTLRSEPLGKIEMTYFFGSVSTAVICSVAGTSLVVIALILAIILIGTYAIDHPLTLRAVNGAKISLDQIDSCLLANPDSMKDKLSERLGVDVLSYQVIQIDYINELARLNVHYRAR